MHLRYRHGQKIFMKPRFDRNTFKYASPEIYIHRDAFENIRYFGVHNRGGEKEKT